MLRSPVYSSKMPMRPSHDAYRSLPGTPIGIDPRSMSGPELNMAMNQVRMGVDPQDYFHYPGRAPSPRFSGGMTSTVQYPRDLEADRSRAPYDHEMGSPEMNHRYGPLHYSFRRDWAYALLCIRINATNLAAQLANSQVAYSSRYGKIYREEPLIVIRE